MRLDNPHFPWDAAVNHQPKVLLSTVTLATTATADFSLPIGYKYFELVIDHYVPDTDATNINLRVSVDGTNFAAGASDYSWGMFRDAAGGAANDEDAADSEIPINGAGTVGTADAEACAARVWLFGAQQSTIKFLAFARVSLNSSANAQTLVVGSGCYNTLDKVKAVRLFASTGNMASGTIRLFGYR